MAGVRAGERLAVGVNQWTVRHAVEAPSGQEAIDTLWGWGLEGLQVDTVARYSEALDPGELAEVRQHAEERSFYLEGGLPQINPLEPAPELLELGEGDLRAGIERQLRALRHLITGTDTVRAFLGLPWDRASAGAAWPRIWRSTFDASRELLGALVPVLRELDLRLAIENHGDATVAELAQLSEAVDPERCGICLDTANLPLTLESPREGVRRAAPHAFSVHLKDAIVVPAEGDDGLVLHARPCGEGVLDIAALLSLLLEEERAPLAVLTVEDHDGLFPLPTHDRDFVECLRATGSREEEAVVRRLVEESRRSIESGRSPTIAELESVPWKAAEPIRAARSAAFVRGATTRRRTHD